MKTGKDKDVVTAPSLSTEDISAFRDAVREAEPLLTTGKVFHPPRKLGPIPKSRKILVNPPQADLLSDHILWQSDQETDSDTPFLRHGLAKDILRKLRKNHWGIQAELDLHGMTSDEARLALVTFLTECQQMRARCVRIIHGKGLSSKNQEPILKIKTRNWLMQRGEVLAYCHAKPADGGGGAVIVLLKNQNN
ncbi:Smr/MutS family protein [Sulfurirhabdus autotrophica]|uniref:DNA-nicking Smr family endonuclease n=1 Tax=Sulfurirhabdus autotrophica TaxID=1706046 RepID=A0A4R3YGN4_9PROT|nr:Smr/MutS family protein [Sulfurirhabdus autotrophica]TCV90104.1 DNA-nicking Smr family endonuclease [Sulfurirhabdus autotrophica]